MVNVFGKSDWAANVTSLLESGEYTQYDETDWDQAPVNDKWIIAEESGVVRESIATTYLTGVTYETLSKGLNSDLTGITYGSGLVVGLGSVLKPGSNIGNYVYVGTGCIIGINCTIGNNVTIGDNATILADSTIADGTNVAPGSVISPAS